MNGSVFPTIIKPSNRRMYVGGELAVSNFIDVFSPHLSFLNFNGNSVHFLFLGTRHGLIYWNLFMLLMVIILEKYLESTMEIIKFIKH